MEQRGLPENHYFCSKNKEISKKTAYNVATFKNYSYLCTKQVKYMSRQQIIDKHKDLFWYTPEDQKSQISDALLVERILNDGTLDDYRELVSALGGKRVAEVFFSATGRQKQNYYPEIYNFFSLVLKKYA